MPKVKSTKRPTFKSKDPKDKQQYHINAINYNLIERLYNEKHGTFYVGPDRSKLKYVLSKIQYHIDGLKSLGTQCVYIKDRPEEEACGCRSSRLNYLEKLKNIAKLAEVDKDDELQFMLTEMRKSYHG